MDIESVQVYDGIGGGLPPEILAIIEESKKLKKEIEGYEDTVKRLQKEIRRLRNMDGEGNIPYKNPYKKDEWVIDPDDEDSVKEISEKKTKKQEEIIMESIQVYDGTDSYFLMELKKFQEQLAAKDLEILRLKSDLKEKDKKIAYLKKSLKQVRVEKKQLDDFITKSIPEFSTEE